MHLPCMTPPPPPLPPSARIIEVFKKCPGGKLSSEQEVYLRLGMFYRPEDTHKGPSATTQADLNVLYWSDEGTC